MRVSMVSKVTLDVLSLVTIEYTDAIRNLPQKEPHFGKEEINTSVPKGLSLASWVDFLCVE